MNRPSADPEAAAPSRAALHPRPRHLSPLLQPLRTRGKRHAGHPGRRSALVRAAAVYRSGGDDLQRPGGIPGRFGTGNCAPAPVCRLPRSPRISGATLRRDGRRGRREGVRSDHGRRPPGALGVSRTTFYDHFDDKRDCFVAAVEAIVEATTVIAAKRIPGLRRGRGESPGLCSRTRRAIVAQPAGEPHVLRRILRSGTGAPGAPSGAPSTASKRLFATPWRRPRAAGDAG